MKSNIDVYLCTEMFLDQIRLKPKHIIIVSCDGDFKEAIIGILSAYKYTYVSVLATPFTKNHNHLSKRLVELLIYERYYLINILTIRMYLELKEPQL